MQRRFALAILATILILPAGCQTEIDDKPAAEVSEPNANAAPVQPVDRRVSVDLERSAIRFVGAKVTRQHNGEFHRFDGWVGFQGDEARQIEFTIDTASLETDTQQLDGHLRSADFFETERFPQAKFVSSSIEPTNAEDPIDPTHQITGTLDLHGVQKEIRFPANVGRSEEGFRAIAEFTIDRQDWGISYPGAPDDLIRDDVLIKLDLFFPLEEPPAESVAEPAAV